MASWGPKVALQPSRSWPDPSGQGHKTKDKTKDKGGRSSSFQLFNLDGSDIRDPDLAQGF